MGKNDTSLSMKKLTILILTGLLSLAGVNAQINLPSTNGTAFNLTVKGIMGVGTNVLVGPTIFQTFAYWTNATTGQGYRISVDGGSQLNIGFADGSQDGLFTFGDGDLFSLGTMTANGGFSGDGSGLFNLSLTNITAPFGNIQVAGNALIGSSGTNYGFPLTVANINLNTISNSPLMTLGHIQGAASDGTNFLEYVTSALVILSNNFTMIRSNMSPFSGLSGGVNHIAPGYWNPADNNYYGIAENYDGTSAGNSIQILSFANATLARTASHPLTGPPAVDGFSEGSGIVLVPSDGIIYQTPYNTNRIFKWSATDYSYQGYIQVDAPILHFQGITYTNGYFLVSGDTVFGGGGALYRIDKSGHAMQMVPYNPNIVTGVVEAEGVTFIKGQIAQSIEVSGGSRLFFLSLTTNLITTVDNFGNLSNSAAIYAPGFLLPNNPIVGISSAGTFSGMIIRAVGTPTFDVRLQETTTDADVLFNMTTALGLQDATKDGFAINFTPGSGGGGRFNIFSKTGSSLFQPMAMDALGDVAWVGQHSFNSGNTAFASAIFDTPANPTADILVFKKGGVKVGALSKDGNLAISNNAVVYGSSTVQGNFAPELVGPSAFAFTDPSSTNLTGLSYDSSTDTDDGKFVGVQGNIPVLTKNGGSLVSLSPPALTGAGTIPVAAINGIGPVSLNGIGSTGGITNGGGTNLVSELDVNSTNGVWQISLIAGPNLPMLQATNATGSKSTTLDTNMNLALSGGITTAGITNTGGWKNAAGAGNGKVWQSDAAGNGSWQTAGAGSGTVTSVTFTGDGTVLSSTPSAAVTASGTVAGTLVNVNPSNFLAGPISSAPTAPTYRTIAATDLPSIPGTLITAGTINSNKFDAQTLAMLGVGGGGGATGTGALYSQTTQTTVANTVTETSLLGAGQGSRVLAANSMTVGQVYTIDVAGFYNTILLPNFQFKVKANSSTIFDTGAQPSFTGAANVAFRLWGSFTVLTTGSSGTIAVDLLEISEAGGQPLIYGGTSTSVVTIDTTINQTIDSTMTWGTAAAQNSITSTEAYIKLGSASAIVYNNGNLTNSNGTIQWATNPSGTNAQFQGVLASTNAATGNYVRFNQGGINASNAASMSWINTTNGGIVQSNGITGNTIISSNGLITTSGTGSGFKGDGSQLTGIVSGSSSTPAIREDFMQSAFSTTVPVGPLGFLKIITGSGANTATVTSAGTNFGICSIGTGTTTTGFTELAGDNAEVNFGSLAITNKISFRMTTLPNGTDSATIRLGFGDSTTGVDPTDGVFLRYSEANSSPIFVCRSNGSETPSTSALTLTAGIWYTLEIDVDGTGSNAIFKLTDQIAESDTKTISSNIPTGTSRATGLQNSIIKTAGTSALTVQLDWETLNWAGR